VGGRVRHLKGWADFPIELGGEFIHGESSLHYSIIQRNGGIMKERSEKDIAFYLDNKFLNSGSLETDEDSEFFTNGMQLVDNVMNKPEGEEDFGSISIGEYIRKKTSDKKIQSMVSFYFESYCGARINDINL